ncbi:unnamed protein product [Haemonchus placei]|uniref:Uncharacterized protein n=1 Tax=Haemonchus placei TaxID=6290 RepID=A0A0N4X7W7_HAEPC|nr:unnamed protein product [Haemonchus placei]
MKSQDGHANSFSSTKDEGAAITMVRTCPKKTIEPPDKEGNGVRGARQATTGSPKEEMAGRDQEGPRRSQGQLFLSADTQAKAVTQLRVEDAAKRGRTKVTTVAPMQLRADESWLAGKLTLKANSHPSWNSFGGMEVDGPYDRCTWTLARIFCTNPDATPMARRCPTWERFRGPTSYPDVRLVSGSMRGSPHLRDLDGPPLVREQGHRSKWAVVVQGRDGGEEGAPTGTDRPVARLVPSVRVCVVLVLACDVLVRVCPRLSLSIPLYVPVPLLCPSASLCLSVSVCACPLCPSVRPCPPVSVCPSTCLPVSVCLYVSVLVCLSVCQHSSMSVYLCLSVPFRLHICLCADRFVTPSVLPVCLHQHCRFVVHD